MEDTATPETGPVDAPASIESIVAEIEAGGEGPDDAVESVTQELVNEAEEKGEPSEEEPQTEDDANQEDESDDEGTPDEPKYTVKVNGEEREVPLTELLKGYSRTEDYKTKTAALAEERRQAEAAKANAVADAKLEYANHLEEATHLFTQLDPVLSEARQIDWEALRHTDPAQYLKAQEAVNQRLTAIQQKGAEIARIREEAQQYRAQQIEQERLERFERAAVELAKERPEHAGEDKLGAFVAENVEFLRAAHGFSNEELAGVLDHRVLKLADEARQWRAHLELRKSLPEKKIVPKSAVKTLTSDGTGSRASKPRFPGNASREAKGDWIAQQILSSE